LCSLRLELSRSGSFQIVLLRTLPRIASTESRSLFTVLASNPDFRIPYPSIRTAVNPTLKLRFAVRQLDVLGPNYGSCVFQSRGSISWHGDVVKYFLPSIDENLNNSCLMAESTCKLWSTTMEIPCRWLDALMNSSYIHYHTFWLSLTTNYNVKEQCLSPISGRYASSRAVQLSISFVIGILCPD